MKQATRKEVVEAESIRCHQYPTDPIGYAEKILGIHTLTDDAKAILEHLIVSPRRVLVPSGHDTGKTHLAAVAISWWYDSFDPGAVFTIGPRHDSLKDTIWGEVRRQRARAGLRDDFIGPSAPEMKTSTNHWAKAFTANKDSSLTGRHFPNMLFVIEEACGVNPVWWEVIMTMFDPSLGHSQLCIFNPTDSTSQAYQEDQNVIDRDGNLRWHRFRLDARNHVNVLAELRGEVKPIPHAVSLGMVNNWVRDGCEPVEAADRLSTDFEWPPGSGQWFRPGPEFQARVMGQWPDAGNGVWSPALWDACVTGPCPAYPLHVLPEIGADMATGKGDDYFASHCRWGAVSVRHRTSNTMDPVSITARLKEDAAEMAELVNRHRAATGRQITPQEIRIKVDDDATGNAVYSLLCAAGYNCAAIGAGTVPQEPDFYPRKRDELWFATKDKAKKNGVYFGKLDRETQRRLKQQLLAPTWELRLGKRCVEPKDATKEKIGRSPDDADATNLAFYDAAADAYYAIDPKPKPSGRPSDTDSEEQPRQRERIGPGRNSHFAAR